MLIMIAENGVLHEVVVTKLEKDVVEVVFGVLLDTDPVETAELGAQSCWGLAQLLSR